MKCRHGVARIILTRDVQGGFHCAALPIFDFSSSCVLCIGFGAAQARNVNVPESQAGSRRLLQRAPQTSRRRHESHRRQQATRRRRHDGRAPRPGRAADGVRPAGHREQLTAPEGHDRPHLFDDEADHRRRDDDPVRRRQVETDGSDQPLHSRVQGPEGLQESRCGRQAGRRPAGPPADDGRADVAHGRLHLRAVRQLAGRQDVPAGERARRNFAERIHRQGRAAAARVRAGPGLGVQRRRRHPGLPGGEAVGPAVRGVPARAHLRAARHERHRRSSCRRTSCRGSRRSIS